MSKLSTIFKTIDYVIFAIIAIACMYLFQGFGIVGLISCVAYLACGFVAYKIAMEIGMEEEKSKLCAYAVITMPVGFYCQFIYGQSEALMVLFVLLGFYFWLKADSRWFLGCFMVATLFGSRAFLVFAILLVLKQKKLMGIFVNSVVCLVPAIVKWVVIQLINAEQGEIFDFTRLNISGATLQVNISTINITIVITLFVIAYAYIQKTDSKKDDIRWSLYLISLEMFAMFGLGNWEPQWLLIMVPFFTFSAFIHKDTKIFMALDLLLMLFFVLFVVNEFTGIADESLFRSQLAGMNFGNGAINKVQMKNLLVYQDTGMTLSFISVLMLVMAFFKHPVYCLVDFKTAASKGTTGFIRARFLVGIAIFLIPALICLIAAIKPPYVTLYTSTPYNDVGQMISDRQQSEVFVATRGKLESVEFCIGTYDRDTDVEFTVKIVDAATEEVLFSENMNASGYETFDWVYVDTNGLELTPGGTYRFDVVSYDADSSNCITIYRSEDLSNQEHGYAFIDGKRQEYHLCVKIMESDLTPEEAR